MTEEAEQIMKRCQAGTRNYDEANNLHAACYGLIGKLLAQRKPLTNGEIYTAYITATNQTLRAQDERLAFAFARAIEAAHDIKE